jgi:Rrf2 family protein
MAANSRMAGAIHILCYMAYVGRDWSTSEAIASSVRTNPVVVRRLLKSLEHEGLVEIRPGKDGGVRLALPAEQITLDRIYRATEGDAGLFALRPGGNPNCRVSANMKFLLRPVFDAANAAVEHSLNGTSLAGLVKAIP